MNYCFIQHEVRKYIRRNRTTLEEEIVSVSNSNNLSIEDHMALLNLNDEQYEYLDFIGNVEI